MTPQSFDIAGLRRVFDLNRGICTGNEVMIYGAATPITLEAEGWIERTKAPGRWGINYKPTQKLKEYTV